MRSFSLQTAEGIRLRSKNCFCLFTTGKEAKIDDVTSREFEGEVQGRDVGFIPHNLIKMTNATFLSIHEASNVRLNNQLAPSTTAL